MRTCCYMKCFIWLWDIRLTIMHLHHNITSVERRVNHQDIVQSNADQIIIRHRGLVKTMDNDVANINQSTSVEVRDVASTTVVAENTTTSALRVPSPILTPSSAATKTERSLLYPLLKQHDYAMFVTDVSIHKASDSYEVGFVNLRKHSVTDFAPRAILFMHVHKGGGTAFCNIMQRMRIRASRKNCLVQKNMRCCGGDSLVDHALFLKRSFFRFLANEKMMYDAIDKKNYLYVTILRKSIDRYLSHFMHVSMITTKKVVFSKYYDWWTRQPDNFIVRQLCGKPCEEVAKYQLTRSHLDYTMSRLRMFDDVMFLESWDESFDAYSRRYKLPEITYQQDKSKINSMSYRVTNHTSIAKQAKAKPIDPLMTALDDVLYEFALMMVNRTIVELPEHILVGMDTYFDEGVERGCTTPCCAAECSSF
jgi:hypothetical protein